MNIDRMYGPAAPENGWIPAPRYVMRRARIFALTRDLSPGRLVEVGCGSGVLLHEFERIGYDCIGIEASSEAFALARMLCEKAAVAVQIFDRADDWSQAFDVAFAFDVLEHIEDDLSALKSWARWLRPDAHLLISVPAHQSLWTAGDVWAGHVRRYERSDLLRLLDDAGFEVERFECYGFPLTNVTERIGAMGYFTQIRAGAREPAENRKANNDRSGVDRKQLLQVYPLMTSWPGRLAIRAFLAMQKLFLNTDLGSGYIVRARRR